jgi:hypothetical protein
MSGEDRFKEQFSQVMQPGPELSQAIRLTSAYERALGSMQSARTLFHNGIIDLKSYHELTLTIRAKVLETIAEEHIS